MTYTSFFFFPFLALSVAVYFLLPTGKRWFALLAASLAFYASIGPVLLLFLTGTAFLSYAAALLMHRFGEAGEKKKRKTALLIAVLVIVGYLVITKFARFLHAGDSLIIPAGISYYSFATVGYLLDVYWKRTKPEKNFFRFLLFVSFFPHILQGPIPRYGTLSASLFEGHRFEYRRVTFGVQRILWGLMMKLVLADRLGVFVSSVIDHYDSFWGETMLCAVFFYAIQIYADFAGCVHIACGAAQIFGVKLEENFRQPYFSRSVEEFWRRWHMTLGHWFRDYVGMPVSVSAPVKNLSRKIRIKYGAEAARNAVSLIALAAVWTCTGLWHGTGIDYVIWAMWQGGIIAAGILLRHRFAAWKEALHINEESRGFKLFQMLRTFLLAGIVPRIITRAPSVRGAFKIMYRMCIPKAYPLILTDPATFGWNAWDIGVAILMLILLFACSLLLEKGIDPREKIEKLVLPLRWTVYLAGFFLVIIFGVYGPHYDAATFIYMDF